MKAIICDRYGPPEVLRLQEVAKPTPGTTELLIRIFATTVTIEDPRAREGMKEYPPLLRLIGRLAIGLRGPRNKILGFELSGEVEAVGASVTRFGVGDQVYGYTGIGFGAYAEYVCLPEDGVLARKPANVTYEEAAAVPNGALTALVFLKKKADIRRGDKVLINGASGSVGTSAVQLARHFGADVTGVCSTRNLDLVRSLGAEHVVDYTQSDFTENGETYDIIFDTVSKLSFSRCKGSLTANGRYLVTDLAPAALAQTAWTTLRRLLPGRQPGKRVIFASSNLSWKAKDLDFLRELIEAGGIAQLQERGPHTAAGADDQDPIARLHAGHAVHRLVGGQAVEDQDDHFGRIQACGPRHQFLGSPVDVFGIAAKID
jgi:NADPH:quinone reductase-like Zn-dependent oxidoreductase